VMMKDRYSPEHHEINLKRPEAWYGARNRRHRSESP
jgi:hypothetical protein